MSLATAAEYVLMLTAAGPEPPAAAPGLEALSPRERELVTLVARGQTDAQIAGQLHISVRTVSSHLDRIRDKTGCRRRADRLLSVFLRPELLPIGRDSFQRAELECRPRRAAEPQNADLCTKRSAAQSHAAAFPTALRQAGTRHGT